MKRKILQELIDWKNKDNRAPLLLYGARQVGKTYIALEFGRDYFGNTIYLNFEDSQGLAAIFERDFDIPRILREISAKTGESIIPGQTLLIFDEIQACERALTSLKYFCEKAPEYHVIGAGSLLGIAVNRNQYSFPVGKVEIKTMLPLDFEEFLTAIGKDKMAELIRKSYEEFIEFSLHEDAMELYRRYLIIGGMPKAVQDYIDTRDFNFVMSTQKTLNDSYIADMAKYSSAGETTRTLAAWNSIPAQLAKENKKFQYKVIKSGARAYDYAPAIDWLNAAGMINRCELVREGKLPLSAYVDSGSLKVYMMDTGLLCSKSEVPPIAILSSTPAIDGFKGALTENYVIQSLVANGITPFYWTSGSSAEVDFVFQDNNGCIIPVEVKSAEHVRSRSLRKFIEEYSSPFAYRISGKNFGSENGIRSVPLYAAFCIEK